MQQSFQTKCDERGVVYSGAAGKEKPIKKDMKLHECLSKECKDIITKYGDKCYYHTPEGGEVLLSSWGCDVIKPLRKSPMPMWAPLRKGMSEPLSTNIGPDIRPGSSSFNYVVCNQLGIATVCKPFDITRGAMLRYVLT